MRRLARGAAPALAALLLAGAACGGSAGNQGLDYDDVSGAWVSIDDALFSSAQFTVTSDSLFFFEADATLGVAAASADVPAQFRGVRRVTSRDATTPAGTDDLQRARFTFTLNGDVALIWFDCPADADCGTSPHMTATRDGDLLTLRPPMQSSLSANRYRRVSTSRAPE